MSNGDSIRPDVVLVPLPVVGAANTAATGGSTPTNFSLANDPRPMAPVEPDAGDCCGEGCVRCVYDVYDTAVERYQAALERWSARHP